VTASRPHGPAADPLAGASSTLTEAHWEALSPRDAVAWQRTHAAWVSTQDASGPVACVAGLDAASGERGRIVRAAAVLCAFPGLDVLAWRLHEEPVRYPYVPGLLSFREAPALLAALRALPRVPDLVLCDGHGRAHPRRLGIASHVGLVSGLPTIGIGKSLLCGAHAKLGTARGAREPLVDRGEVIGEAVRTRAAVRPVYVSVGHRVSLARAVQWVLACSGRFRLPGPVHAADRLAGGAVPAGGGWSKVPPGIPAAEPMSDERRQTPREARVERLLIQISAADGAPDLAGATLASRTSDVSAGGLALRIGRVLPTDSHVELWVRLEGERGKYFLAGTVRWSRPDGEEHLHGIEFSPAPGDDLERWRARFA
jgi:deoxyribonuclease V